jgi:type I restriction enzyme S subunit
MNTDWSERQMGEVLEFFDTRRVPLNSRQRAERQGQYPYYGASGIVDYIDDFAFDGRYLLVAEDGENLRSRKTPVAFFANGRFWVNNHAHVVRGVPAVADDQFLKDWFAQADINGYITGAAQPKLSQESLKRIRLRLPPLPTQRRIASILSAYDDLIENNTRRIEILEEMTRSLYREWFVFFRFPGHKKVKLVDSELGKIPEGWEVRSASEVLQVNPTTRVPKDAENVFLSMTALSTNSMLIGEPERRMGNSGTKFKNGDTLFARITPCLENGKTGYVQFLPTDDHVACGSTEFIVLREGVYSREMVYLLARLAPLRDHLKNSMSGATGRQRARDDAFKTYRLAVPKRSLIANFTSLVRPLFRMADTLGRKNAVLRQTRDLLLPKLISGEIDVDSLGLPEPS